MSFSSRRAAAGLTLEEVSREFSFPLATVSEWEDGRASPPRHVARSLEVLGRFTEACLRAPSANRKRPSADHDRWEPGLKPLRIISLFSGAGGLDLGLIQAGHKIAWANDFDPDAAATYRANIGPEIVLADICGVSSSSIPEGDVVVGGFPCQGFSQANMLRFAEDERNRLYLEFLRIVRDKQPRYFLAENVRGILSLAGGRAIAKIESDFAAAGYRVSKKLFNVADFGVPQMRKRVIIAGTRADLPEGLDYRFPQPTHAAPEKAQRSGLKPWVTIAQALAHMPEPGDEHDLKNHVFSLYKVTNRNFTGHRWTDPDKPSPTILARGNGKGGVCAIQHPRNHRRMSIREQAAIQTFPDDFNFVGRLNSAYRQVGNAVPVLFGRCLGEQLALSDSVKEVA